MFETLKIKLLQQRFVDLFSVCDNVDAAIEELNELRGELEMFKFIHSNRCQLEYVPAGNLQKEIEDVAGIIEKLRIIFNVTHDQRKATRKARRKIVRQMKQYLTERGYK